MTFPDTLSNEEISSREKEWTLVGYKVCCCPTAVCVYNGDLMDGNVLVVRYDKSRSLGVDMWERGHINLEVS